MSDPSFLFIFKIGQHGEQVLVHKEVSNRDLSYDELNAWFASFKSQLSCGEYQFDYVTLAGIREALNGNEALSQAELAKWKSLSVGETATEGLAGTVWNEHAKFDATCTTETTEPVPPTTTTPPTTTSTTGLPVTSSSALVPLPTVTTQPSAQAPVHAQLATTGAHDYTALLIVIAVLIAAVGTAVVTQTKKVLDRVS